MNIIEKIRHFWKNKNQKALPEAQMMSNQNTNKKQNRKWILSNTKSEQTTKLDREIDAFLHSYSEIIENTCENQTMDSYKMAYSALVRMNGKTITQEEYNNNYYQEQLLLNQLYNNNKYTLQTQGTKDRTAFYHVKSCEYQMPPYSDILRIYINCNNANISELSNLILSCNKNPNFYMKFTSNISNATNPRGEKIVIYCDKKDFDYNMRLIQYTKNIRPDLYKESENVLPFLQNVDNTVSVSRQPLTDQFIDLYGNYKRIPQSTNAFLATTLKDSYIVAAREIARCDQNLAFLLQEEYINDEILYMKNYPYIDANYHDYLLKSMEAKMEVLSARNNLYIDGLHQQIAPNNEIDKQTSYYRDEK